MLKKNNETNNLRLNRLEDTNFKLFHKTITLPPRPSVNICQLKTETSNNNLTQNIGKIEKNIKLKPENCRTFNVPIPPARPLDSGCHLPKEVYRDSHSKHNLSYGHIFTQCLHGRDKLERPHYDMIWNGMTKQKFIAKDPRSRSKTDIISCQALDISHS